MSSFSILLYSNTTYYSDLALSYVGWMSNVTFGNYNKCIVAKNDVIKVFIKEEEHNIKTQF